MARALDTRHSAKPPSLFVLLPLLFCLFASTATAASAVLGIDLGTNFIKAVIVKPGTPLDIVLTKDSKRKEAGALAFKPAPSGPLELGSFPERLYGGDALAISGRFPGDVYSNLKPLLGIDPTNTDAIQAYKSRNPAANVFKTKDKYLVAFKSSAFGNEEQPWTVEELLAMELKNIRTNAEVVTKGSKVTDAVITIPPFYNAEERKAVARAADLAGIHVMGLITDGLAVGLDYAVKREFPNVSKGKKAELHLVFDMGASSTTATVLRFQAREVRDVGRLNKTIQEVQVAGTGWDRTLGGNALNDLILDNFVKDFVSSPAAKSAGVQEDDVRKHGRAISKLWKESERARQVLSANTDVRSSFEELFADVNFASKLSRMQFEEIAAPFAEKVEAPIQQALDAANISINELGSIILYGGAVRTPFVKAKLEALAGKSVEIRSNVNTDEAAAFGAAFKAASLSPLFRVKDIRASEAAIYDAGVTQLDDGKMRQQSLFIPTSLAGKTKHVSFKNKEDFEFEVYQDIDGVMRSIQVVETKNLTAGVKFLTEKFGCSVSEIKTTFTTQLTALDALPEITGGTLSCTVDDSAKKAGIVDSVKGLFGGKKEQEPLKDAKNSKGASSKSSSAAAKASGKVDKNAKEPTVKPVKTESVVIDLTAKHKGNPVPTKDMRSRMIERLAAFDRSDKASIIRAEAFNNLEGFTYKVRDLLADSTFESFSTEAVRKRLSGLLTSTSDWLYGEGASADTEALKARLADFTDLVNPVQLRQKEAAARPELIKTLKKDLDSTRTFLDNIAKKIADAASSASSAATAATSSVSSAVVGGEDGDNLDDLEEPETSSTSSTSPKAPIPSLLPYTQEDLKDLTATYEATLAWLKEKTLAQDKLKPYDDAAFTIKDVEAKAAALTKGMTVLIQKKLSLPPIPPAPKKSKVSSKTKSAKSAASSAASSVSSAASGAASAASSAAGSASSVASSKISSATGAAKDSVPDAADTPSQEEILEMVRNAASMDGVLHAEPSPPHEEL